MKKPFVLFLLMCFMACGGVFAIAQGNKYTLGVDAFYDNGICRDGDNKRITGIVRSVDDDGDMYVWQVKNGLITFSWAFYPSGRLATEFPFKNGVTEGNAKLYYESGRLKWTYPYVNDKKQGVATGYADNGRILMKITYKNDRAVSGACANGRALTFAELTNLMNGLNVDCY